MKQIASAMVKAQKGFGQALKSSSNPHFKSRYADLAACVEAVIDALNDNGIALLQQTHECADGVVVETLFIHESGEQISGGKLHVPATKHDAQGYGSALTYARRYSLMASCGIAPEDDDGNAASRAKHSQRTDAPSQPTKPPKPPAPPAVIKATDGADEFVDGPRKAELDEAALDMIEAHRAGNDKAAIAFWYEPSNWQHQEEQVYVWKLLASESKLRATIKANKPQTA